VTPDFEAQLRAVSLRVTRPRLAVLAALRDHPHIDTETVIGLVRADHPTVSHQAVYDVLRVFTDAGLVRRSQPAGAMGDVDCAVGHTPCLTASDDHGYVVDEAEVVYWGTCPDCAAERTPQ
jgi:Fe2+ or Zn2+ uptake regulation protein